MRKWLYLSPWGKIENTEDTLFSSTLKVCEGIVLLAKIDKTKGTLFSQTFKVKENKVSSVFSILHRSWDMAIFSYSINNIK